MIITLTGANDFLRHAELEQLVGTFVSEIGDMGLERLDGEEVDFQKLYDALTSLPFLVPKKMLILTSPSANKAWLENAEKLLSDIPATTDVILVESKLDKRTSYYKFLKAATDFRDYAPLDANGLVRWLTEYVKSQHGVLNGSDARFLVDRVGANQQLLKSEVDKLLLYETSVTRQTIELLTEPTPQSTVFELLDAAFSHDATRTLRLYQEQRALKVEPQQIIALLGWQLQILAVLKTAGDRTPDQIAREAKINPFVVRKSSAIVRRLTLAQLKTIIHEAVRLDISLKSVTIDADEALQLFLLKLAT